MATQASGNNQYGTAQYGSSSSRDQTRNGRDFDNESSRSDSNSYGRYRGQDQDSDRSGSRGQYSNQNQSDSQNQYGSNQNQRFSRDSNRDDSRDGDESRQYSSNQYGNQNRQGQRDYSRDHDRDQVGSSSRDYNTHDGRNSQSAQNQSGRSDQHQSGSFDQRGSQQDLQSQASRSQASGGTAAHQSQQHQINRGADIGLWFDRAHRNGLVVSDVSSSGPISRFGFREGDQIMSVNGQRVASEQQFISTLMSPQFANQRAQVMVWRNGQQVPVWVEPWVLNQGLQQTGGYAQNSALEQYGIVLDDRYQAPVVWKVTPRSPAYYAGIRGNDVIVAWNNQHVNDPDELSNVVGQTDRSEVPVQISRNRQLRNVTLEADGQTRTALRPGYDQSYDQTSSQQGAYAQPQEHQQGYSQPSYTTQQQGGYTQPQQGTYQQNRPGILPFLRGR